MEERYSLALGLGELTHCFVEEKFSSEDNLIFMKVAMWDSKRSWCKVGRKNDMVPCHNFCTVFFKS